MNEPTTVPRSRTLPLPPPSLRVLHERLAPRLKPLLQRLPMQPPAWALALMLDRLLLPKLPADARAVLSRRPVAVVITDLGLDLRLRLDDRGFAVDRGTGACDLRIAASLPAVLRLLRGEDDADRLFFERQLVMEGDTEMGLVLKNTLDAIGPLFG